MAQATEDFGLEEELLLAALGLLPYYPTPFKEKSKTSLSAGPPNMRGPDNPNEDTDTGHQTGTAEMGMTGTTSKADRGALGFGSVGPVSGRSIANAGLKAATVAGFAPASIASGMLGPLGTISAIDLALRSLGVPERTANPWGGIPSAEDVQSAFDFGGNIAGAQTQAEREAAIGQYNTMTPADVYGLSEAYGGTLSPSGPAPGGWGTSRSSPSPSVANPDIGSFWGGGGSAGGSGAGGVGMGHDVGGESGYGGGGVGGEGGPDRAKGGVDVLHRTKRLRFAEKPSARPEVVISFPQKWATTPGLQGNEQLVKQAMESYLRLMG